MKLKQFRAKALIKRPMAHPGLKPGVSAVSGPKRSLTPSFPRMPKLSEVTSLMAEPQVLVNRSAGTGSKNSLTPDFSLGAKMTT